MSLVFKTKYLPTLASVLHGPRKINVKSGLRVVILTVSVFHVVLTENIHLSITRDPWVIWNVPRMFFIDLVVMHISNAYLISYYTYRNNGNNWHGYVLTQCFIWFTLTYGIVTNCGKMGKVEFIADNFKTLESNCICIHIWVILYYCCKIEYRMWNVKQITFRWWRKGLGCVCMCLCTLYSRFNS